MSVTVTPQTGDATESNEPTGHSAPNWKLRTFILPAVILVAQIPLLIEHGKFLWGRTHYQFFPILLVAVAILAWIRWPRVYASLTRFWKRMSALLLVSGLFLLAAATLLASPNLAILAFVLSSGGLVLLVGGKHAIPSVMPVWLLTWLLVSPPLQLDVRLITTLQTFTSTSTSVVLELLGIEHLMTGNVLHLPGKALMVEEACSGVQSLFALLAATAIYLVWQPRSWINGSLLLLSVIGWALFANVLRVFTIAYAYDQSGIDLSSGRPHEVLGYCVFAVALLMIVSTDQFFNFFLSPIDKMSPVKTEQSPFSNFWNLLFGRPNDAGLNSSSPAAASIPAATRSRWGIASTGLFAVCAVFLGILQVANWQLSQSALENYQTRTAMASAAIEQRTIPASMGNWEQNSFKVEQRGPTHILGQNSKTWEYRSPIGPAVFSCDFPFFGWHELSTCYQAQGWQIQHSLVQEPKHSPDDSGAFLECDMTNVNNLSVHPQHAFLVYGHFDGLGRDVQPAKGRLLRHALSRLNTGLKRGPLRLLVPMGLISLDSTSYQVQVFVTSNRPISAEERKQVRQQFQEFRKALKQHWREYADPSRDS